MMYALLRAVMRTITSVYLAGLFHVSGSKDFPRQGPLIICSSHSGTIDPPLVPAFVPRSDTWNMAKSEYFRRRVIAFWFRQYHAFPVVRHSADRNALRRSFDLLKAGQALIIYPEGTRVESGGLATPEPGAGFIAQKSGCPVVPVGLVGTRECLPKGARWPRRVPVSVTFGEPFLILAKREDGTKITHQEASDAIMLRIAELLPSAQRGAFSDLPALRLRLAGVTRPVGGPS
jgi:1-acyl-sn-glycerol-3-phosphate acyltransferase